MSIDPVSNIALLNDSPSDPNVRVGPQRTPSSSHKANVGTHSNREILRPQAESASFEIPEDEVQVQRDPAGSGQIVIKYLDGKGNLILQVPSSQVLGLARAIEQALAEQARDRAEPSPAEEGGTHAD